MQNFIENYHADTIASFRNYKRLAERAMEQVSDDEFFFKLDPEANSIGLIAKHIGGNLISRWTDFLTSDGEKPTRNRDAEFEMIDDSRGSVMQLWESGWRVLFANVEPLTPEDFGRTVTIRGEPHTVVEAVNRQLTHYAYHVGQIILLAKHFRSSEWKTLSVPRNRSADFNKLLTEKQEQGVDNVGRFEVEGVIDELDEK